MSGNIAPATPFCACGCGEALGPSRITPRKWAKKKCYMRATGRSRKSEPSYGHGRARRGNEPSGRKVWRERSALLLELLRELGPLRQLQIESVGRERYSWTPTIVLNVLAWSHPLMLESGGVWRIAA